MKAEIKNRVGFKKHNPTAREDRTKKKTYSYDFCKNAFVENKKKVTELSNSQHDRVAPKV
jgi:hypothetical protein